MSEGHAETEWQKAALKVRQLEAENARLRNCLLVLQTTVASGEGYDFIVKPQHEDFSPQMRASVFIRAALTSAKEKI